MQKTGLNGSNLSANGQPTPGDSLIAELRELVSLLRAVLQQNAQILQILIENDLIEGEEPITYLDGTPVKS
jgi:hypothetical protein